MTVTGALTAVSSTLRAKSLASSPVLLEKRIANSASPPSLNSLREGAAPSSEVVAYSTSMLSTSTPVWLATDTRVASTLSALPSSVKSTTTPGHGPS